MTIAARLARAWLAHQIRRRSKIILRITADAERRQATMTAEERIRSVEAITAELEKLREILP